MRNQHTRKSFEFEKNKKNKQIPKLQVKDDRSNFPPDNSFSFSQSEIKEAFAPNINLRTPKKTEAIPPAHPPKKPKSYHEWKLCAAECKCNCNCKDKRSYRF